MSQSKLYKDKDWLYDQYWNQGKSTNEIGEICSVHETTIGRSMRKLNIPKRSLSEIMRGRNPWNKGKPRTEETKRKIAKSHKNKEKNHSNKNNPNWKGNDVGYAGLHIWVNRHNSKIGICQICNEYKETEWANIDHKYKRRLEDFIELCHSCHKLYDKTRREYYENR